MKKGLIYFVVFLFVVQLALAEVIVDPISRDKYNLGDRVNVKGEVLFEQDLQGSMNVDLKCDNQTLPVYFSLLDLKAGESQSYDLNVPTRESLQGNCLFLVSVSGIVENFEKTSDAFIITKELNVDISINKILANPGDGLEIIGNAKRASGDIVEDGVATLTIDGNTESVTLKDGILTYLLQLSPSINSGKHVIGFSVEDKNGNSGMDDTSFKVNAIPTEINLIIDQSYVPGESIVGKALLYDQSGEPMNRDGSVDIYNSNREIEFSKNIKNNENFEFVLDSFSIPGDWRINVAFEDIETNKNIDIEEIKKIDTWLEGGFLYIKNVGNVDYIDPVEITIEGSDMKVGVTKETSLKPNQTIQFDLDKEVKYGGEYQVKTTTGVTGNVVLEGRRNLGSTITGWVAIVFIFGFFIYMVTKRGRSFNKVQNKKSVNVKEVRAKGREVLERTQSKEDKIRQEDINNLLDKVREKPRSGSRSGSDSQNMFRIFD